MEVFGAAFLRRLSGGLWPDATERVAVRSSRPPSPASPCGPGVGRSILASLAMCRNIKTLFNFDPPATEDEIEAAALQFVRKLSGFNKPSRVNEEVFHASVARVAEVARELLSALETKAPAKDRDVEAAKARERSAKRFA